MILMDLSHTSHTHARTGVQRVARNLHQTILASGTACTPLTWDPYRQQWRTLLPAEQRALSEASPADVRKAKWPWPQRLRGYLQRWLNSPPSVLPPATGFIMPEIFSPGVARALPSLLSTIQGPRVALFHDAVALRLPELSPPKTVARFPAYLQELLLFDGIAAISEESRAALEGWWNWLGIKQRRPALIALPLAIDTPSPDTVLARTTSVPIVLAVGSLEGRKNHLALLEACETLWQQGHAFELRLIGLSQQQTGGKALSRMRELQAAGRPLRYDGAVEERMLIAAYHECAFTVYPSVMEGFGLPVLESISYGKPCICSARGALGESARGGGCLSLPEVDASSLASAIAWLLTKPDQLHYLSSIARKRVVKSWPTYTHELLEWMKTLTPRPPTHHA